MLIFPDFCTIVPEFQTGSLAGGSLYKIFCFGCLLFETKIGLLIAGGWAMTHGFFGVCVLRKCKKIHKILGLVRVVSYNACNWPI